MVKMHKKTPSTRHSWLYVSVKSKTVEYNIHCALLHK